MDWSPWLLEAQPFVHGSPVALGTLRAVPEDFQVDEIAGFVPDGEGEHLFLQIRKRNQNTAWVAGRLAEAAGVREDAVSHAGLKDRRAVTTQWFSIHLPHRQMPDLSAVWNDEITLLAQTWNSRKLRRGAHQGNRFVITLREVEGDRAVIEQRLQAISAEGVPNYIGPQRFGHGNANLEAGERLLAGRPRRKLGHRESLALSAVRSALFNRVLGERIALQSWNQALPGDVLILDWRGSFFRPEPEDMEIPARLQKQELHPTGPFYGKGVPVVSDEVLALEEGIAGEAGDLLPALVKFGVDAQRRALRLRVADLSWMWGNDDSLELSFALPSGAFATSVLRELVQLRDSDAGSIPVE